MFIPKPTHAPNLTAPATLRLLAIGVGKHAQGSLERLGFVAPDVANLLRALEQVAKTSSTNVELHALVDEQADASSVQAKLRELGRSVQPADVTLLYLAGHGIYDPNSGGLHFATYDATEFGGGLAASLICQLLFRLPGRRLLIADMCSAGAIAEPPTTELGGAIGLEQSLLQQVGSTSRLNLSVQAGGGSLAVLMASGRHSPALESRRFAGGVFTRAVIEGLSGDGDNGTGCITVRAFASYVRTRVERLTDGQQQPCLAIAQGESDFVILGRPRTDLRPPQRAEDPLIGRSIAGFRITARIEQTPRYVLYSGVSTSEPPIAVQMRVLTQELSRQPGEAKRFIAANQLLREFSLAGFTTVYELGRLPDGRCHVLVGTSGFRRLRDVLACGPLPPEAAYALLCFIAQALAGAHQKHILYGSLTPSRVLVDAELKRFLLAEGDLMMHLRSPAVGRVRPSGETIADAMDSLHYQAPETRVAGAELTEAVDVYALAALGIHVLLGQPPFVGDTVGQLEQAQ